MKKVLMAVVAMFICSSSSAIDRPKIEHVEFLNQARVTYDKVEYSKIVSQLAENEMAEYNLTWDSNKTLEQNQKALLKTFMDTCCDFSFELATDSGVLYYQKASSNTNIVLYDEKNMSHFLNLLRNNSGESIVLNEVEFLETCNFSSYREKILNALQVLSKSSIGCELFRVMVAKYKTNKMPKTIFVPCSKNKTSPIEAKLVFSVMQSKASKANEWRGDIFLRNTVILFNFEEYEKINFLFVSSQNQTNDDFVLSNYQLPLDAVLLHEMIHVMHMPLHLESLKVDFTIDSDMRVFIDTNKLYDIMLSLKGKIIDKHCVMNSRYQRDIIINSMSRLIDIWIYFLSNDEEFVTMFGIGSDGLNLLNEAAYMAETYKCMRVSHCVEQDYVYGTTFIAKENMKLFLIDFIRKCGDFDLYGFYLNKPSSVKYPCFGINQYKCLDLDSVTGMPKLQ